MKLVVERTARLEGTVAAPPSKSHAHRAMIIASLAQGRSVIRNPPHCDDTLATINACSRLGARVEVGEDIEIVGVDGKPKAPGQVDVGESGATMRFITAVAALCRGDSLIAGRGSLLSRPIQPLLGSLGDLGVKRAKALGQNGCPPVSIVGGMRGGQTTVEGTSSQFLSALLLACPMAEFDSYITVNGLRSRPYADMTLWHLDRCGVRLINSGFHRFFIPGSQRYSAAECSLPGDHSAAAFIRVAEAITDSRVDITGLDTDECQGDSAVEGFIEVMGRGDSRELDLTNTPDLLPVLAVLGCFCEGETSLSNVRHARLKESDRIRSICTELARMGADIREKEDGLVVRGSELRGAELDGHGDHRIVMALAVAGLGAEGRTIINGGDAISKSYPGFVDDMARLGARMRLTG